MSIAEIGGITFFFVMMVALVTVVVYFVLKITQRRRISVPIFPTRSHVNLYFEEHFPDLIREWDLITSSKLDNWVSNMSARLEKVGNDISTVKSSRGILDSRLDKLDERVKNIESV
jgi:hypothetical protein